MRGWIGMTMVGLVAASLSFAGAVQTTGTLTGRVTLQGQRSYNGTAILVDGQPRGVTDSEGRFRIDGVATGPHTVAAQRPGYLTAQADGVSVVVGQVTPLRLIELLAGDATGNNTIDLFDMTLVSAQYDTQPPGDARADINGDGQVGLGDLVLVAANYEQVGPQAWAADTPGYPGPTLPLPYPEPKRP